MYSIQLDAEDIDYILSLLYEQRYKDSAGIIHSISAQVNEQIECNQEKTDHPEVERPDTEQKENQDVDFNFK